MGVLLVEDDAVLRERLARAFAERGYAVQTAADGVGARERVSEAFPDLAVIDLRLPDGSGLEVLRNLLRARPACRALVLTGYGSITTAVEAVHLGAVNYLPKPTDADEILAALVGGETAPLAQKAGDPRAPSLGRAEWEHIQRVLAQCGGNISQAARLLGIHRRSLQRKLQKYPPAD
jgi:two-component system response regulator RegA